MKKWRCKICGYVYEGDELPEDFTCPVCGYPASEFEEVTHLNYIYLQYRSLKIYIFLSMQFLTR